MKTLNATKHSSNLILILTLLLSACTTTENVSNKQPNTPPARMDQPDDLVVIKVKLDKVMQPKSITDTAVECTKNPVCKMALDAAAAYAGVDSTMVTSAVARIDQKKPGEEGFFTYYLPEGYRYCRAKAETVSVVPKTGDIASFMSIRANDQNVGVYTWTPRLQPWEGRSWIEVDFTIIGVRNDLIDQYRTRGICKANFIHADCRGGEGISKGQPACGVITD